MVTRAVDERERDREEILHRRSQDFSPSTMLLRSFARQVLRSDLASFPQLLRRAELHVGVIGAPFNKGQVKYRKDTT